MARTGRKKRGDISRLKMYDLIKIAGARTRIVRLAPKARWWRALRGIGVHKAQPFFSLLFFLISAISAFLLFAAMRFLDDFLSERFERGFGSNIGKKNRA